MEVDAFDNRRRTALLYAARYGRTFAVSRLLDARANIGFADRVSISADRGVYKKTCLNEENAKTKSASLESQEGQVPLFAAACNEHLDTVDLLLRAGANINATDQWGTLRALDDEDENRIVSQVDKLEVLQNTTSWIFGDGR